jgi:LysM repeat protein
MRNKLKDPRIIGFIAGFAGVTLIGLVVIASLTVLRSSPAPTLVPTAAPVSERVTAVSHPSAPGEATSLPGADTTPTSSSAPTLTIPAPTATRSEPIEHTVREGDTLFGIALAYGISVETIRAANDLVGDTIIAGQLLVIPPGPLPTPTSYFDEGMIIHTVSSGETLIGIAEHYSVTVETIQSLNELDSEIIQPGWKLRIPAEPSVVFPTATARAIVEEAWQPSILEGDLESGYPLTVERERFTMHYQPDTPAAGAPQRAAAIVEEALLHIENTLQVILDDHFDVYMAGSLFAPDATALRGRSFSSQLRNFYLYDDTGTPAERRYIITHELTHLVAWNTVGRPSSVMLHEGLAVYTGLEAMESAGFLPLEQFCAAYQRADQLPRLAGNRDYLGHIRDLDLYFSAGCFVKYLIEEYGIDSFKQVFTSGDYPAVYRKTQAQLEADWGRALKEVGDELNLDPDDLVSSVVSVADAYERLFTDFTGTRAQMAAYLELDQARIAMLQGRFEDTHSHLSEFETLLEAE